MLEEGLRLMAVGMTTVFGMLGLLVLTLHASAALFARLPDDEDTELLPDEEEELMLLAVAVAAARRARNA